MNRINEYLELVNYCIDTFFTEYRDNKELRDDLVNEGILAILLYNKKQAKTTVELESLYPVVPCNNPVPAVFTFVPAERSSAASAKSRIVEPVTVASATAAAASAVVIATPATPDAGVATKAPA